jgi:hypothetical protein
MDCTPRRGRAGAGSEGSWRGHWSPILWEITRILSFHPPFWWATAHHWESSCWGCTYSFLRSYSFRSGEVVLAHFWQTNRLPDRLNLYQCNPICLGLIPSCFVDGNYFLLLVSIWKLVVSMKLLMLPLASGMIGSSGEKRHSPSTMNLYLIRWMLTGGGLWGVAKWYVKYNCDGKHVILLF